MKCFFCSDEIPKTRIKYNSKYGSNLKYCSTLCCKRAWYLKNDTPKHFSVFFGLPQKGIAWEEWFMKKYGGERPSKSLNTPYDFILNNERIDLKVSNLYHRKMKRGKPVKKNIGWWCFHRNSDDLDYVICIGLINDKPIKMFKIPNNEFPKSGITITPKKSKYDKYIISF